MPREIQTDSRFFYEAFKETLADLEIPVVCFPEIPALARLRASFKEFLERGPGR